MKLHQHDLSLSCKPAKSFRLAESRQIGHVSYKSVCIWTPQFLMREGLSPLAPWRVSSGVKDPMRSVKHAQK